MKKALILFLFIFSGFSVGLKSQDMQMDDSTKNDKKAVYLNENLPKFMTATIYPRAAIESNIQGNVVIAFTILKDGKMDNIKVLSSPDRSLSASSLDALKIIGDGWSPCISNGIPIDKEYYIVFRYRISSDTPPSVANESIIRAIKNKKYEKALKYINAEIKENPFDYKLFDARSKIYELLGDNDNAKKDTEQYNLLKNNVMDAVDVIVVTTTRVMMRTQVREQRMY